MLSRRCLRFVDRRNIEVTVVGGPADALARPSSGPNGGGGAK